MVVARCAGSLTVGHCRLGSLAVRYSGILGVGFVRPAVIDAEGRSARANVRLTPLLYDSGLPPGL